MFRHTLKCFTAILVLGLTHHALARTIEIPERPAERPRLKSIYGVEHELADLKEKDARAIVLVFLGTDCPVAQQYIPTLLELHHDFRDRGVRVYGIYPNASVNIRAMAIHAHDQDLPFPVFLDRGQKLSKLLDVSVTPEVVVLDGSAKKVVYQGAIDNQFKRGGRISAATEFYLRDALASHLAGREIEETYRRASGCPLEKPARPRLDKELTYHRDIAPLVQKHCQGCHRPGGVGPFELLSYDDAFNSAERIQELVEERRMPPWHGYLNEEFGKLEHPRNMSEDEIATFVNWVDQGAAAGNPQDAPQPIQWPSAAHWDIGQPDYVYKTKSFTVPKSGTLEYQFFRVPMRFEQDRWISAVQVKPGDPRVVHHIGLHIVPAGDKEFSGFAGMAALYGFTTEKAVLINDYVPGDTYNAVTYAAGQAVKIPKNSDLIFEVHYTTNGRASAVDQSMVGFKWAKGTPEAEVRTKVFRKPTGRFRIPPYEPHFSMEDSYHFDNDVLIDAVRPHFHYRGKSYRVELIERDPKSDEVTARRTLLTVPIFDEGWQRTYELETPLLVKAGTEIIATGNFDNSRFNPRNPNPHATVQWGQQTTDEMFSTRFKYRLAKEERE